MAIRQANIEDLEQITKIYNQAVRAGFQAGNTIEVKVEDRIKWLEQHLSGKYPIFVYESDNCIAGWISISPYTGLQALRFTAELIMLMKIIKDEVLALNYFSTLLINPANLT